MSWCTLRALPAIGESCEGLPYCARGSFCDHSTCAGPLALGALCEGVEDFLERPQCGPSARCDFVTCTCAPRFELGASCSIDGECASDTCRHGACAAPGTCGGAT